jgi:hypothetical protein
MANNCQATTALILLALAIVLVQNSFNAPTWTAYQLPVIEKTPPWDPCPTYVSCDACTRFEGCGWCRTEKKCKRGSPLGPTSADASIDVQKCRTLNTTYDSNIINPLDLRPEFYAIWEADNTGCTGNDDRSYGVQNSCAKSHGKEVCAANKGKDFGLWYVAEMAKPTAPFPCYRPACTTLTPSRSPLLPMPSAEYDISLKAYQSSAATQLSKIPYCDTKSAEERDLCRALTLLCGRHVLGLR